MSERKVRGLSKRSTPIRLAVEEEHRSDLMLRRREVHGRNASTAVAWRSKISLIALVAERACSLRGLLLNLVPHLRLVCSSDPAVAGATRCTCALLAARPAAKWVRDDAAKLRDLWLQRPASTHVTGTMTSAVGWDQDRQVDGPILFRADELLPVDDQHR